MRLISLPSVISQKILCYPMPLTVAALSPRSKKHGSHNKVKCFTATTKAEAE
jgi:hypothetical protein